MNVVKVYLKEVHEEKPYTTEWFKQFSDKEFVKVTATWISFGAECKKTILSELETICIHKASLFPELDTVSQYLRNR